jgi:hypothetical protein
MPAPQPELSRAFQWHPWPPGDPAPEIWRIIQELDRKVQLRVVDAVLNTQIAISRAHVEGLESVRKIIAGAQG